MPLLLEVTQVENPGAKPVRLKVDDQVRVGWQLKKVIEAADRKRTDGHPGLILRLWDAKAGGYMSLRDDERLVPGADGVLKIGLQRARPLAPANAPMQQQQQQPGMPQQQGMPQQRTQQPSPLSMMSSSSSSSGSLPSASHAGAYASAGAQKRGAPDLTPAEMQNAKRSRMAPGGGAAHGQQGTPPAPPSRQETGGAVPRHASAAADLKRGSPAPPSFYPATPGGPANGGGDSSGRGHESAQAANTPSAESPSRKDGVVPPSRITRSASRAPLFFQSTTDILDIPCMKLQLAPLHERCTLAATVDELLRVSAML